MNYCLALLTTVCLALLSGCAANKIDPLQTSIASNHPLVGTWRIDLPRFRCHETYRVYADGTTRVSSGQQLAESVFQISATPSEKGFYKWIDKIVKQNGKPDCTGSTNATGDVATNYILLSPTGSQFLMCEEEDLLECIGPFIRQGKSST